VNLSHHAEVKMSWMSIRIGTPPLNGNYTYTYSLDHGRTESGLLGQMQKSSCDNGGTYTGQWKDGYRHGFGVMRYTQHGTKTYEGEWLCNRRHGRCKYWFKDYFFEGVWEEDTAIDDARVKCVWRARGKLLDQKSGHCFEGELGHQDQGSDLVPYGRGRMVYANPKNSNLYNAVDYEGEWCNGHYSGNGRIRYHESQNHRSYDGQWSYYPHSDVFRNDPTRDMRSAYSGTGKLIFSNGNTYEGTFRRRGTPSDMLTSNFVRGVFTFAVDSEAPFKNSFMWHSDGFSTGSRSLTPEFNAGDKYEGEFDGHHFYPGLFHGECTYTFFNGEKFKCRWFQGKCPEFEVRQAAIRAAPDPASAKARVDADAAAVVEALAAADSTVTFPPLFSVILMFSCARSIVDLQVACYRYDPKALFKKWDSGFVTISSSRVAHGSAKDKTLDRALGKSDDKNVMLISGFFPRAVDEFAGRAHIIAIDYPSSPSVPVQYVSFEHPAMRDSFLHKLQVCICHA
jgi:hypothetical protein